MEIPINLKFLTDRTLIAELFVQVEFELLLGDQAWNYLGPTELEAGVKQKTKGTPEIRLVGCIPTICLTWLLD